MSEEPPETSARDEPAAEHPEETRRPTREILGRAVSVATVLVQNKDLLVQALELLRKAQAVTPREEAELMAAYETGGSLARQTIFQLVEKLQNTHLGEVVIALRDQPDLLRSQGKALAAEARAELHRFLDENQPALEAVERVSENLQAAGRELAESLRGAGREAAEHLLRRGKEVLLDVDAGGYEQAALEWAMQATVELERRFTRILITLGILFATTGTLVAGQAYPEVRTVATVLLVALLLWLGLLLMDWGVRVRKAAGRGREELDRLARMDPQERRDYLAARFRRAKQSGADPGGEEPSQVPTSPPPSRVSRDLP